MEQLKTVTIAHMAKSHWELAHILEAERDIAIQLSRVICALPDQSPVLAEQLVARDHASQITKTVSKYLNSLSELEEAIAENLEQIMVELEHEDEE